jgi:hypothetical protein
MAQNKPFCRKTGKLGLAGASIRKACFPLGIKPLRLRHLSYKLIVLE